jgi:hypothetical protein
MSLRDDIIASASVTDWLIGIGTVEHSTQPEPPLHYISGCCRHWIKSKNPNAPALKREAEIDWGR